ncbi:MAG: queuosine precursor transporter [Catalinimonas sp.]
MTNPSAPTPSPPAAADRRRYLFLVLSGIFLTNALVAEVIGVKIFSVEGTLGLAPGALGDYNLSAGAVIWPVVFITTDVINEYFGPAGVKRISYLTAAFIAYAFVGIGLTTLLPPATFWLDINATDAAGRPFDVDFAFRTIFRQGLGIIVGSLVAFLIGQLLDAYVFQFLRRLARGRYVWLRATGSTLVSQLVDSFVVLWIAFFVFGNWTLEQVVAVSWSNYLYKFLVAVALTPLLYVTHALIDRYLGVRPDTRIASAAAGS